MLDRNRQPLMPCHPKRARLLLKSQAATVFRRESFYDSAQESRGRRATESRVESRPGQ